LIKQLQRQLQNTSEALQDSEQNKAELNELLHATLNSPAPTRLLETPGPHGLQERAQRPEDIEYQERLRNQTTQEHQQHAAQPDPHMLEFMKQLAKAVKDTNTSDLTEPSKFSGPTITGTNGTSNYGPTSKPKGGFKRTTTLQVPAPPVLIPR
jgi:hypothetical protein